MSFVVGYGSFVVGYGSGVVCYGSSVVRYGSSVVQRGGMNLIAVIDVLGRHSVAMSQKTSVGCGQEGTES